MQYIWLTQPSASNGLTNEQPTNHPQPSIQGTLCIHGSSGSVFGKWIQIFLEMVIEILIIEIEKTLNCGYLLRIFTLAYHY